MATTNKIIEIWNASSAGLEEDLYADLQKLFPSFTFHFQKRQSENESYPRADSIIPHLLVCDQRSSELPGRQLLLDLASRDLKALAVADPHLPVLHLVPKLPSGEVARKTLDQGVRLLLTSPFRLENLEVAIKDILAHRFETFTTRTPRIEARHRIHVRIASIEQAIASETLNIGSGGLFIRMQNPIIKTGDHVDFELQLGGALSQGQTHGDHGLKNPLEELENRDTFESLTLHGSGTVAWVRPYAESAKSPEGIGIRFKILSPEILKLISKYLASSSKEIPES